MSKCPICGKDDLNLFRDEACLDCRTKGYLNALRSLGRSAVILPRNDPSAPSHSILDKIGSVREGCIRLDESNINFIELWRTDARNVTWFTIAYLAIVDRDYDKKAVRATLGEAFSAFHQRKPLREYRWKGGELAKSLTADPFLKEALVPNKGQFEIGFNLKQRTVVITEVVGDHYPDPDLQHIEAVERIVDHMRRLET